MGEFRAHLRFLGLEGVDDRRQVRYVPLIELTRRVEEVAGATAAERIALARILRDELFEESGARASPSWPTTRTWPFGDASTIS